MDCGASTVESGTGFVLRHAIAAKEVTTSNRCTWPSGDASVNGAQGQAIFRHHRDRRRNSYIRHQSLLSPVPGHRARPVTSPYAPTPRPYKRNFLMCNTHRRRPRLLLCQAKRCPTNDEANATCFNTCPNFGAIQYQALSGLTSLWRCHGDHRQEGIHSLGNTFTRSLAR